MYDNLFSRNLGHRLLHHFGIWNKYLVGGLEHVLFSIMYGIIMYGIILPIDYYFSRWLLHHQPDFDFNFDPCPFSVVAVAVRKDVHGNIMYPLVN